MAKADPERFSDLFQSFGHITVRRMFGGEGLLADGRMIGLVMDDRIFLKTDAQTRKAYVEEKMEPFAFRKNGKVMPASYYAIPDRLYDDAELFARWARQAEAVCRSKPVKKKR